MFRISKEKKTRLFTLKCCVYRVKHQSILMNVYLLGSNFRYVILCIDVTHKHPHSQSIDALQLDPLSIFTLYCSLFFLESVETERTLYMNVFPPIVSIISCTFLISNILIFLKPMRFVSGPVQVSVHDLTRVL